MLPRTHVLPVVVASVVVLLAACGGGGSKAASTTSTTKQATTTTAAPTSSTNAACAAANPSELVPLLPTTVPAGYALQPDAVGDTGPSDFNKAVSDDGEKDAATVLRNDGFRRGYQRLWQVDDNTQLIVFVYDFCTPTGAQAYTSREVDFTKDGAHAFAVPGVAGAQGFSGTAQDGVAAFVFVTQGHYSLQVQSNAAKGTPEADAQQKAIALMAELDQKVAAAA